MTVLETVARYYDAWQHRHGDFGDVPLAAGFRFSDPVATSTAPRAIGRWPGRRGRR